MTDLEGLIAIHDLISALDLFESVEVGRTRPRQMGGNQSVPSCWIQPVKWREQGGIGSGGTHELDHVPDRIRVVQFAVHLTARESEGPVQDLQLVDQLAEQVCEAIGGQALGGAIPILTGIDQGEWGSHYPESGCRLDGSFSYYPGPTGSPEV